MINSHFLWSHCENLKRQKKKKSKCLFQLVCLQAAIYFHWSCSFRMSEQSRGVNVKCRLSVKASSYNICCKSNVLRVAGATNCFPSVVMDALRKERFLSDSRKCCIFAGPSLRTRVFCKREREWKKIERERRERKRKKLHDRRWKIQIPALVWSQMQHYPDTSFDYTESSQHFTSKPGSNLHS